ncbi:MAG: M3 family metallopeptidase, partial [Cellulomonadaceae bacterium]|nr:M3 family metallopeptidase [Cellulomonadaceae bacterium]
MTVLDTQMDDQRAARAAQLLMDSGLPYGLPDFAGLEAADYEAAIMAGIAQTRAEIAAIVANPEPPTLANTLSALEAAGQLGIRAWGVFHNLIWSDGTKAVEAVNERIAPQVAAFRSELVTNRGLYKRLFALSQQEDLPPDARYLLEQRLSDMRRAGASLTAAEQERLHELDQQLASLEAKFGRQLLAATNEAAVLVTDEAELAGLSDEATATLAAAAQRRGVTGWLIELELPTQQAILASLENRELRRRIQATSEARGTGEGVSRETTGANGAAPNQGDTRETLLALAKLRAERANLLGFDNHAALVADNTVIGSTAGIDALLKQFSIPAIQSAQKEAERLTKMLQEDFPEEKELQPYDWAYYANQVRKNEFDFDPEAVKPYFELNSVLHNGIFFAANKLFGLNFVPRPDLKGYHDDVTVYEVFDGEIAAPNEGLGLVLYDPYARETKRKGAWMNSLILQSHLLGYQP